MTLTSSTNKDQYTGNGSASIFPYNFRILDRTNLEVTKVDLAGVATVLTIDTDYTVAGVGNPVGSITLVVASVPTGLASGYTLTIRRVTSLTQPTRISNQGSFNAATHEKVFDKLTMQVQDRKEVGDRSLQLPVSVTGVSPQVPAPVAGKILAWKADGTGLENITPVVGPQGPAGVSVPSYASAAARNAANPTPATNTLVRRTDTGAIEAYNGSAWVVIVDAASVVNVRSRGAGTGVAATDTPIILAALAEAIATPLTPKALYFPGGGTQYAYDATIAGRAGLALRGVRGFICFGDGSASSQIWYTGAGGTDTCMWRLEDVNQAVWSDLFIRCNGQVESVFLSYNNGGRSGVTPTGNQWHNVFVDGVSGTDVDYCWSMIYMPWSPSSIGTVTVAAGGAATFAGDVTQEVANAGNIRFLGDGTLTITGGAGATTFSQTQAGKIQNGSIVQLAGVDYTVSAFNGTTGATLTGAANQGPVAFYHNFQLSGRGNGIVNIVTGAATFTHDQTSYLTNGTVINVSGVGNCDVSAFAGTTCTLKLSSDHTTLAPTNAGKTFTVTSGGTDDTHKGVLSPSGFATAAFGAWTVRTFDHKSPLDQNNDLNTWYNSTANLYKVAGWLIGHSQAKIHRMYGCEFQGGGGSLTKYGVKCLNGSFRWNDGNGGGNRNSDVTPTAGADFYLGQPTDNIVVSGGDFEGSARLLETSAGFGPAYNVQLLRTRWSGTLNTDGFMVDYNWCGPLIMEGGFYGNGSLPVPKIRVRSPSCSVRVVGNSWDSFNSATTKILQFDSATDAFDVEREQNSYVDGGGASVMQTTFADGATAPWVHFGNKYRTANTALTTIRDLQDPYPNQKLEIIFGDSKTVLQSGGNIQLVGSVNWGTSTTPIPRGSSIRLRYSQQVATWEEVDRTVFAGPADITTLVANIEGATGGVAGCVFGIYDARYNVDVSAGRVISWRDARGLGNGPALIKVSGSGPTWDSANNYVVSSATAGDYLSAGAISVPLGAGITGGSLGFAWVGEASTSTNQYNGGWSRHSTAKVPVQMQTGSVASTIRAGNAQMTLTTADLASGATTRSLYIARRTQSGGNAVLGISRDNGAETVTGSTADASETNLEIIVVGADARVQVPASGAGKCRATIFLTVEPTAAIRLVIRNWSNAQHGTA